MNQLDIYISNLLNFHRENSKDKYPCNLNDACCGICDHFYPCLFDLLRKIKSHAFNNFKARLKKERL